jgi:hypothetical protein
MAAGIRQDWFSTAAAVLLLAVLLGMLYAPALLSSATIGLVALPVLFGRWSPAALVRRLRDPTVLGLVGLYLLVFLSVWQTEDWAYYTERLRIKLPLFLLPLAWAGNRRTIAPGNPWTIGRWVFLAVLSLTLTGVLLNYGLHFAEYNQQLALGRPIPVPRANHVRFSLLLALGCVVALPGFLIQRRRLELWIAIFLFVGLHILAVRTGLVAAYVGLSVYLVRHALRRGQRGALIGVATGLVLLPLLAYATVPALRTKVDYMRFEWRFRNADEPASLLEYSDAGRMTSIRLGLEVWRQSPWFGVGFGNLNRAMADVYAHRLPGVESMRPHNQFISALVAGGVFGLVWTVGCFTLLAWGGGRWRDPTYLSVFTVLLLSCLVENTLETSVGVTLFTLTLLLTAYPLFRKPG